MSGADTDRRFGAGPLSRIASLVYTLLVLELLLLVTTAPGVAAMFLLDRDPSNLPLAALCALPLGPAVSATLYALHHYRADLTDLHPAAAFWRGYRANLRGVLLLWTPLLVWLTIIGVSLTHRSAAGVPGWWVGLLGAVGVVLLLWGLNALVITSLFTFRLRDVARLALYLLPRQRGVTLSNASLLVVATGVTVLTSEVVLALLGSVLTGMLLWSARPLIATVRKEFTA